MDIPLMTQTLQVGPCLGRRGGKAGEPCVISMPKEPLRACLWNTFLWYMEKLLLMLNRAFKSCLKWCGSLCFLLVKANLLGNIQPILKVQSQDIKHIQLLMSNLILILRNIYISCYWKTRTPSPKGFGNVFSQNGHISKLHVHIFTQGKRDVCFICLCCTMPLSIFIIHSGVFCSGVSCYWWSDVPSNQGGLRAHQRQPHIQKMTKSLISQTHTH